MAHPQPRVRVRARLLAGDRGEQAGNVERVRAAGEDDAAVAHRPDLARAVRRELDADAVGVGKVDRLVRAVVGGAVDRNAELGDAPAGARELLARGEEQREVVEAGVVAGGRRRAVLVQHDEVLAAGAQRGVGAVALADGQPDHLRVEADRAVEVGDPQVDRAERASRRRAGPVSPTDGWRWRSSGCPRNVSARAGTACNAGRGHGAGAGDPRIRGREHRAGGDRRVRERADRRRGRARHLQQLRRARAGARRRGGDPVAPSLSRHPPAAGGARRRARRRRSAAPGATHVLLAGYMRPLGPAMLEAFAGRIYNTHPALLPAHGGRGHVRRPRARRRARRRR